MFYVDPYDGINTNLHLKNLIPYSGNEEDVRKEISDRIRDIMKSAKCSQEELAGIIGVSSRTIERRLNNEKDFRLSELYEIAQIFNVSIDYICYGTPSLPSTGELAELLSDRSPAELAMATRVLKAIFNVDDRTDRR